MVPLLGTPNVALSGLAFSQATNCLKSLTSAGTAVPTKTQNSNRVSWLTGTKSFAASKLGVVSTIGSRYIVGPVVTRMVVPSGLAPFTALMPISPSPPVRFSTMMLRSSKWAEVLRQQPAQRVAATAGRKGKDDFGQRARLRQRLARPSRPVNMQRFRPENLGVSSCSSEHFIIVGQPAAPRRPRVRPAPFRPRS